MTKQNIINYINKNNFDILMKKLEKENFKTFVINDIEIKSKSSFFNSVKKVLPQDPPIGNNPNYDSFSDSIWGGLSEIDNDNIAIIWINYDFLMKNNYEIFENILDIFNSISLTLTESQGLNCSKNLKIYLLE